MKFLKVDMTTKEVSVEDVPQEYMGLEEEVSLP